MTPSVDPVPQRHRASLTLPSHLKCSLDERWLRYRKAFKRCRRKYSEDSVHQLRVETRRLLALVELLGTWLDGRETDALRDVLKDFFDRFAPLRDTHVQLLYVSQRRKRFPGLGRFCEALARRENRLVRKLRKRLARAGQKETKRLVSALRRRLKNFASHEGVMARGAAAVARQVSAAHARVVRLQQQIDPGRGETIHRTRIAFKRFRYLVELLQPLLPGIGRRQLQAMHRYQTRMGEIQDLEVLRAALEKFLRKKPQIAGELEAFGRDLGRRHAALIDRYVAEAHRLHDFWPPHLTRTAPVTRSRLTRQSDMGGSAE